MRSRTPTGCSGEQLPPTSGDTRCPYLKLSVLNLHDEASVRQSAMAADALVLKRAIATDLLDAVDG